MDSGRAGRSAAGTSTGRPSPHHSSNNDSDSTIQPSRLLQPQHQHQNQNSVPPQPTAVPHAPASQSAQRRSDPTSALHGPDRLASQPPVQQPAPAALTASAPTNTAAAAAAVRFDEAQLAMFAMTNASRIPNIKDELALAAGRVTPGVDDSPYILYAIEALTRDRGGVDPRFPSGTTSGGYSVDYPPQQEQQHGTAAADEARAPLAQPGAAYVPGATAHNHPAPAGVPLAEPKDKRGHARKPRSP
jgi:hypothetical protein